MEGSAAFARAAEYSCDAMSLPLIASSKAVLLVLFFPRSFVQALLSCLCDELGGGCLAASERKRRHGQKELHLVTEAEAWLSRGRVKTRGARQTPPERARTHSSSSSSSSSDSSSCCGGGRQHTPLPNSSNPHRSQGTRKSARGARLISGSWILIASTYI